jgi:hypothetical protein
MAGTLTVNTKQTFSAILLISATQKTKYGTDEPDITKSGERKYAVECAVTYLAENGMRPISEVISVGLIGGDLPTIAPGTPVEWDSLRAGVSAPEKRENGKGIAGGKLWWQGSGLRPVQAQGFQRPPKPAENAA